MAHGRRHSSPVFFRQPARSKGQGRGFSLIELLFVIIIMGIIAVIAIPLLFSTVKGSRPVAAINNLRTIASAEVAYSSYPPKVYGRMPDLAARNFLDTRFSADPIVLEEYQFSSAAASTTFTCSAVPLDTLLPSYYVNHTGIVYFSNGEVVK